ncbi:ABC transporter substrate-binding protein [Caulobacter segnis]
MIVRIAALAAMLILPCAATAETVLRARLNADILSFDPGARRDENTDAVILHVVEGLVASREDGAVAPMLASRWTVSPDGRLYTFTLRQGVTFHNGAPLTSAEVVWSLKRYLNPKTRWRCRFEFGDAGIAKIESITAPDPGTVAVRLSKRAPMFLKTLSRGDCGGAGIMHPSSVGPDGAIARLIGTGPFEVGAWKRNQYVELTRFARYAALPGPRDGNTGGKRALVDKVRFLVIPDGSAARAALLRGNLDVLDALSPTELAGVRGRKGVRLEINPTMDLYTVLFQTKDPVLADPRLRRAIALSIDTAGLAKAVTWDTARGNSSPVPRVSPFFGPVQARLRPVDLAEARRLAKAAGYRGQPIRLITNRRYPQCFDAAVLVQAMAAQAGINIQIDTLDWATQLDRYTTGEYQAMIEPFSARLDPSLNFGVLIGDKTKDPRKAWGAPQAREMLKRSMEAETTADRQEAFDDLQNAFMEETPAIALFSSSRIAAVRQNVTGYKGWPAAQQRLWGVGLR